MNNAKPHVYKSKPQISVNNSDVCNRNNWCSGYFNGTRSAWRWNTCLYNLL